LGKSNVIHVANGTDASQIAMMGLGLQARGRGDNGDLYFCRTSRVNSTLAAHAQFWVDVELDSLI